MSGSGDVSRAFGPDEIVLGSAPTVGDGSLGGVRGGAVRPRRSLFHAVRRAGILATLLVLAAVNVVGLPYYLASHAERMHHPLRPFFKPSGLVGQGLGVVAFAMFVFLWLYPLRKKFRWLAFTGGVARWLDVHIVFGMLMPLLGAMHASWRFTGLIGLGYAAMLVVSLSGIIGRYLYTRIPRSRSGMELTRDEMSAERTQLLDELCMATRISRSEVEAMLSPGEADRVPRGFVGTLLQMVKDDIARRRAVRVLVWRLSRQGQGLAKLDRVVLRRAARLASREIALEQQLRMLDAVHQAFRFWHVAHRPVAISALLAVLVHVGVAVSVHQTWFW